jgi:hypothetical protein
MAAKGLAENGTAQNGGRETPAPSDTRYDLRTSPFMEWDTPFTYKELLKLLILGPLIPIRLIIIVRPSLRYIRAFADPSPKGLLCTAMAAVQ